MLCLKQWTMDQKHNIPSSQTSKSLWPRLFPGKLSCLVIPVVYFTERVCKGWQGFLKGSFSFLAKLKENEQRIKRLCNIPMSSVDLHWSFALQSHDVGLAREQNVPRQRVATARTHRHVVFPSVYTTEVKRLIPRAKYFFRIRQSLTCSRNCLSLSQPKRPQACIHKRPPLDSVLDRFSPDWSSPHSHITF
jgi:hypothetical protein